MKIVRQGLAVFLFLLFATTSAFAQHGTIAGTVTASSDGSGLAAVQVHVLRSGGSVVVTALTGASGAYRIEDIPPGTYSVSFLFTGWERTTEVGVVVADGETTTVSASLLERAFTLNPITVTTSKKVEKVVDAPASVQVVTSEDIAERPATTLADHVREKAGVDVVTTGLQSNHTVVRGFNNIFSGSTLSMTDNRIARVPSLRVNLAHIQPTTNLDVERVEVVLGPGSALYGPNAANGVIHYLTNSPIDAPGATLSIASGFRQQGSSAKWVQLPFDADGNPATEDSIPATFESTTENVVHAEGRYAYSAPSGQFGFKVSGQYFTGNDYNFIDEEEVVQQTLAGACAQTIQALSDAALQSNACLNFSGDLTVTPSSTLDSPEGEAIQTRVENVGGGRDYDLERYAFDVRADFRPSEDVNIVLNGGRTTALNSVDLTGIGGGQVKNWDMLYGQARANVKRWFGQVFFNKNSNDETFLLRSGRPLSDKSSLFVGQLQHGTDINENHSLIYGFDYLHTVPQSEGTINGRHEDDDTIDEVGGYVQYEGALSDMFELVLAARVDKHSRLDNAVFSPRAAIVYKPDDSNSFRLTFNRAFTTPTTLNFFLDLSQVSLPITGPFRYDIRVQGTSEDGFSFNRDGNNIPMHMSPFNPLLGGSAREFLPTTTDQLWDEAVALVSAGDPAAGGLLAALGSGAPGFGATVRPTEATLPVVATLLDPGSGGFIDPIFDLTSILDTDPLIQTTWQTLEAGYKGLLGSDWLVEVNGYWTQVNDFISALQPITRNVFLPQAATQAYLQTEFTKLVGIAFPDQATADGTAALLASTIGKVPFGSIVPSTAGGLTDAPILFTYRNLGDFNLYGADLAITYVVTDLWQLSGTASWVSDETFDSGTENVPLNAPSFKGSFGARYRNSDSGISAGARARFVTDFPVNSGVYVGDVEAYSVFDLNFGIKLPGSSGLTAQLDVQNVFDNSYSSFPGTPDLGRFTMLRLIWTQ